MSIDRDAWAAAVRRLLQQESAGNITAFARAVGISARTVHRWLARTVDVSEESVRTVAARLGQPALGLLAEVGYYPEADPRPAAGARPESDPIEILRQSGLPLSVQVELAEHLAEEARRLVRLSAISRRPAATRREPPARRTG